MRLRTIAFPLFGLILLGGCKSSSRSISLKEGDLEIGHLVELLPQGSIALGSSRDGKQILVAYGREDFDFGRCEVRSFPDLKVLDEVRLDKDEAPLLFNQSSTELYLWSTAGKSASLVSYNLKTGARQVIERGLLANDAPFGYCNSDRTLATTGHGYVLAASGKLVHLPNEAEALFDQFGNAWYRRGLGWVKIDHEGGQTLATGRPSYLVQDQAHDRGPIHLSRQETTLEHNRGTAYLSAIWLDHDRARSNQKRDNSLAALVYAGVDVDYFSFVPSQPYICVISRESVYFVPYQLKRSGGSEASTMKGSMTF